ncbi:MAG: non-hydrolyzing UDP-N-acetylglucosamine 2-epimerase [Sphingomonadaceae bacterium]
MVMKILTIVGARPQFIKAAMLNRAIRADSSVTEVIVHTGQHHDSLMSDIFFEQLDIEKPDHALGITGGTHGDMTGRMMVALDPVLLEEKPDRVLVYGDTNSTLAAALCASKFGIPVVHVEAGLRSYNHNMPEEINRVLTDHVSSLLFCPTDGAVENLAKEGITQNVENVGDIMLDAALFYAGDATKLSALPLPLRKFVENGSYILATIHRQENTESPARMQNVIDGLLELARSYQIVLPLHPRTRHKISASTYFLLEDHPNIHCVEPLGYLEMLQIVRYASLVVTDSGGLQKEAFFFKGPCATLRDQTEWNELVSSGWNILVDTSCGRVAEAVLPMLGTKGRDDIHPYGDGQAADKILARLLQL